MSFSVEGKTAIVTGAANGVGLEIAQHLADQGANVMFADMDEDRLSHELGGQPETGNIRYFAGDLRSNLCLANLLSATIDAFDQVDILVNASRQILPTDPLDVQDQTLDQMLQQNLFTAYRLTQLVAKRMIKQAADQPQFIGGSIVNLSSIAANRANMGLLGYSVATAALDQMTRMMAIELAPHNIRVNAVAFGSVLSASLGNHLRNHPEDRETIEAGTPLGRIGAPGDLAHLVQYLASDAARFTIGQIFTVDGGRSLLDAVQVPAH